MYTHKLHAEKKPIVKANPEHDKCDCHELLNANLIWLERSAVHYR